MADKKKRIGPITFAKQVQAEGSKVTWTSRGETISATILVLIMSILIAIFLFFGDMTQGNGYREQSASLKKAVYAQCFDEKKGLMADVPIKDVFSQHSNIFAVLTNTIPKADQEALMKKVLSDTSLIQTTIYFKLTIFVV